jgi:hypothetical protein
MGKPAVIVLIKCKIIAVVCHISCIESAQPMILSVWWFLQNCVGLPEGGHGSCSETCMISSDDAHKVVRIKAEEDTDEYDSCNDICQASPIVAHEFVNVKVEEETDEHDSYSETYLTSDDAYEGVSVKADDGVNVKVEEDTDDSCSEACLTSSDDTHEIVSIKVEADTDIQEENVSESIAFPVIQTEPEVRLEHCCMCVFMLCQ